VKLYISLKISNVPHWLYLRPFSLKLSNSSQHIGWNAQCPNDLLDWFKNIMLAMREFVQYHLWSWCSLWPQHSQFVEVNSTYHFSSINKLIPNQDDCSLLMKSHSRMGSWLSVIVHLPFSGRRIFTFKENTYEFIPDAMWHFLLLLILLSIATHVVSIFHTSPHSHGLKIELSIKLNSKGRGKGKLKWKPDAL
jgi:hypothetical protein